VVARKPLSGTVAGNVLVWGTGGLNIDGCRVGTDGGARRGPDDIGDDAATNDVYGKGLGLANAAPRVEGMGRWPANIVLDGAAAAALDQQTGYQKDGTSVHRNRPEAGSSYDSEWNMHRRKVRKADHTYGGGGGGSRYFTQADFGPDDWPFVYQAKPSKRERNAGLDGMEAKPTGDTGSPISNRKCRKCGLVKFAQPHCTCAEPEWEEASRTANANHHPTVKPVALMRHLVRLVTPPGGTVLDPFAGSGTTLVAAVLEGMNAIGCEMTDEYLPIIRGRVAWAEQQADAEQPRLL
jgi:hypothetical protein